MKVQKKIGLIFAIIGAVLLGAALFFFNETTQFLSKAREAEGIVVDITDFSDLDGPGKTIVRFETEEGLIIRFTSLIRSNPNPYNIEESVPVLYLPEYPQDARINSAGEIWLLPIILGGIGGIFFITGGILLFIFIMSRRKLKWLQIHGRALEAEIQDIKVDKFTKLNGKNPYRIFAEIENPENGEIIRCKSDTLWQDPAPYLKERGITKITVLVDPDNYKKNIIDTEFLQEKRGE